MAANKTITVGPIALTTTLTTNILNPGVTSMAGPIGVTIGQPYLLLRSIKIVNKTGAAATVTLYLGATGANAAGTELALGQSVPANSSVDISLQSALRMDSTQFLVGGSNTATALVLYAFGEVGISG